jgi:hypothetical protein
MEPLIESNPAVMMVKPDTRGIRLTVDHITLRVAAPGRRGWVIPARIAGTGIR